MTEVKAAKNAQEQGESALAARETTKVFFEHLAGYKARPFLLRCPVRCVIHNVKWVVGQRFRRMGNA